MSKEEFMKLYDAKIAEFKKKFLREAAAALLETRTIVEKYDAEDIISRLRQKQSQSDASFEQIAGWKEVITMVRKHLL